MRQAERSRRAAAAVVAMLALLGSAGCGGDGDAEPSTQCKAETENTARAGVIAEAFEQGKLGTQAEVDADFPGDKSIFDAEGHMLAYDELKGITRARFDEWAASGRSVRGTVQLEADLAMKQVRDDGWPDC